MCLLVTAVCPDFELSLSAIFFKAHCIGILGRGCLINQPTGQLILYTYIVQFEQFIQ